MFNRVYIICLILLLPLVPLAALTKVELAKAVGISVSAMDRWNTTTPSLEQFLMANQIGEIAQQCPRGQQVIQSGTYGIPSLLVRLTTGASPVWVQWPALTRKIPMDGTGKMLGYRYTCQGIVAQLEPTSPKEEVSIPTTEEEYGNKYLNLLRLHALTQGIEGVEVPLPQGIRSSHSHRFLDSVAPQVGQTWDQLGNVFQEYRKTADKESWPAFLEKPEVVDLLTSLNQDIETAYQAAASNPSQYGLLGFSPEILEWLKQIQDKGHYLMVRSSGAEDTKKLANAGGNLSVAYVSPTPYDVAIAVGRVIASYYSLSSLKNRLVSGDDPFVGKQRLAVTLMELVGEPVGGVKEESAIPVSLVLFTNEPLYTNGGFRIMRISSTYGHGESVVNNMGIGSDTFLILDSTQHPDDLYVVSQISPKTERLVPIEEDGRVSLQKRSNPEDRVDSPTFDPAMLKRLYALGIRVEKAYGYPMDMELVVKDGTIFPVQARPVNRPEIAPTYLDRQQMSQAPSSMSSSDTGKVVVVGAAEVEILTSPDQILRAVTLEKAQESYKKGKHKVVVVNHDEPANSHPVVNFSSWGVPVLFFPDSSIIDALIPQASDKTPIVVDSQSGLIGLWNRNVAAVEDFIKTGYLVHPANLSPYLAVAKPLLTKRALYTQMSPEMEQPIQEIRDVCFTLDKIPSLRQLQILKSLQERANQFGHTYFSELAGHRVQRSFDLVDLLQNAMNEAIGEWELSLSLPDPDGLRCRFYAKVVEKTLADWLPLADEEVDNVQRMADYQIRFSELPLFAEEAGYRNATWDKRSEEAWIHFLTSIEKATKLPAQIISRADIERFQETLRKYDELGILPKWMFLVFSPTYLREAPEDLGAAQNPTRVREMFQRLLAELKPEVEEQLQLLQTYNQRVLAVNAQLDQFDDPKSFDRAWKTLQEAIAPFLADTDGGKYLESIRRAPVVSRLVASDVMGNVVDLVDSAIKRMLTSSAFSDEQKVDRLGRMLKIDYALFHDWVTLLITRPKFSHHASLSMYLNLLERGLSSTGNSPGELHPMPGFDVSKATIENPSSMMFSSSMFTETNLPVNFPVNKEGYFTLIHQNLLSVLQRYIGDILPRDMVLPKIFEGFAGVLATFDEKPIPSRVRISGSLLTIAYNIPLRDHSALLKVVYDKNTEIAEIEIRFFGVNEIGRWVVLGEYAKLLAKAEGFTELRPSEFSSNGVSIFLSAKTSGQATAILKAFKEMRDITFVIALPYETDRLWNDIETRFDPHMRNLSVSERTAVLNEVYLKALLYGEKYYGSVIPSLESKGLKDAFINTIADWMKSPNAEEQKLGLDKLAYLAMINYDPSFITPLLKDEIFESEYFWNTTLRFFLINSDQFSDILSVVLAHVDTHEFRAKRLVLFAMQTGSVNSLMQILEKGIQSASDHERMGAAQTAFAFVNDSMGNLTYYSTSPVFVSGLFAIGERAAQDPVPSIKKLGEQLLEMLRMKGMVKPER